MYMFIPTIEHLALRNGHNSGHNSSNCASSVRVDARLAVACECRAVLLAGRAEAKLVTHNAHEPRLAAVVLRTTRRALLSLPSSPLRCPFFVSLLLVFRLLSLLVLL